MHTPVGWKRFARTLLLSLLPWLLFTAVATAQPRQVCIIRHAEKPLEGNHLSLAGRERAAALVPLFLESPELLEFRLPVAIYAQSQKKETSSLRAIETVKPLAESLKLTINEKFNRDQFREMVADVLHNSAYKDRMVLICWEHKIIPEIVKALGVEAGSTKFPDVYDRVWTVTFRPGQKPAFNDLPQRLMFGDAAK